MIKNVLQSFGSITAIRILSRVFQFLLKAFLIRNVLTQQVLAHMIHLDLVLTASLHVVKSCFKPSYQKLDDQANGLKSAMNTMTFGILVTIISSVIVCTMQHFQFISTGKVVSYFTQSIFLYGLAAVFQSIAEKYMTSIVLKYQYFRMGIVEMASFLPKTVFIFFAARFNLFDTYGIMIFAIGHLIYTFLLMVINFALSPNKNLFLQSYEKDGKMILIDASTKQSLKDFSFLSFLKLILQEFERIVLVVMDTAKISSVYTLISNLGSIVVRYIFAPLNEIMFNYFSRGDEKESVAALIAFVKATLLFSVLSLSFGFNYSESFLLLLYGEKWVDSESILAMRTYTVLLSVLGLNGIVEAFTFARGAQSISKYKYYSVFTTAIYILSSTIFVQMSIGATSFFLGNAISMLARIVVCWNLQIKNHIKLSDFIKEIKPSKSFLVISFICFGICHKSYGVAQNWFTNNILIFGVGGLVFVLNLMPIVWQNREYLMNEVRKKLGGRKID